MSRREELLADHVYIVGGKAHENVDAPNGIPYQDEIDGISVELLNGMMEHLTSTLVDVDKKYPEEDTMSLGLEADFIVMRREHFDELYSLDIPVIGHVEIEIPGEDEK